MALDRGSKIALTIATIIGVGGFIYWMVSRRKMGKALNVHGISKLSSSDTFAIYPKKASKRDVAEFGKIAESGDVVPYSKYPETYATITDYQVGDIVKIVGGGKLNGTYEIFKLWYLDTDPTKQKLIAISVKNKGQWDGVQPSGTWLSPKSKRWIYTKSNKVPQVFIVERKV
jgi:hypothetical protein